MREINEKISDNSLLSNRDVIKESGSESERSDVISLISK